MNIHIFYSHYNVTGTDNKNRPYWFDYEKCFINLLNTIKENNVFKEKNNIKLNIVMDGNIEGVETKPPVENIIELCNSSYVCKQQLKLYESII